MNDSNKTAKDNDDAIVAEDEEVAKLMALAGPRPAIPRDVEQRVRASVHREWRQSARRVRVVRWAAPLALAATVVIAVMVSWQPAPVPMVLVGTVARVNSAADAAGDRLVVGQRVGAGDTLTTGASQSVSVALVNGVSLRLASDSALRLDDPDAFTLLEGSVYADTGVPVYRDHGIRITTPVGSVTDVGTQFSVSYADQGLRVAVREGSVDVAGGQRSWSARAGQLLTLRQHEEAVLDDIAIDDSSWDWAIAVAPLFDIDNRSLLDFLRWGARETGKELVFADDDVRRAAMQTTLHGSVSDSTPEEATQAVLDTTRFRYRVSRDAIVIDR